MTQVVRLKWLLVVGCANAALALAAAFLVLVLHAGARRSAEEAAGKSEAELRGLRAEVQGLRGSLEGMRDLRASVLELRDSWQERPAPQDAQLSQTLQLLAGEQQLLLLKTLRPQAVEPAPKPAKASARRVRRRPARTACPIR